MTLDQIGIQERSQIFTEPIWPLSECEPMRGREIAGGCGVAVLADIARNFEKDFAQENFRTRLGIKYEKDSSPEEVEKANLSIDNELEKKHIELSGTSHLQMEEGVAMMGLSGKWCEYESIEHLIEEAEKLARVKNTFVYVVLNIMTGENKREDGHYVRLLGVDPNGYLWRSDPEFRGSVRKEQKGGFERDWCDYSVDESGNITKYTKNAMIVYEEPATSE